MKRSICPILAAATVAAAFAHTASADPFATVELVARPYESTAPYSSTISVGAPDELWEVAVLVQLAPAGTTNSCISQSWYSSIARWTPSSSPAPSGINSLRFNIDRKSVV